MQPLAPDDIAYLRSLPHTLSAVRLRGPVPAATERTISRIDRLKKLGLVTASYEWCGPGQANIRVMLTDAGAAASRQGGAA